MELKQESDLNLSKIPSGVAKSIFADIQMLKQKQIEEKEKWPNKPKQSADEIRKSVRLTQAPPVLTQPVTVLPITSDNNSTGASSEVHFVGPTTSLTGSFLLNNKKRDPSIHRGAIIMRSGGSSGVHSPSFSSATIMTNPTNSSFLSGSNGSSSEGIISEINELFNDLKGGNGETGMMTTNSVVNIHSNHASMTNSLAPRSSMMMQNQYSNTSMMMNNPTRSSSSYLNQQHSMGHEISAFSVQDDVQECPPWDIESMKLSHKQDYNYCHAKIESMLQLGMNEQKKHVTINHHQQQHGKTNIGNQKNSLFTLTSLNLQEITQNLIIPSRFSYKYLNPARLLKSLILENKKSHISFLRIKIAVRILNSDEIAEYVKLLNALSNTEEETQSQQQPHTFSQTLKLLSSRIQYAAYTPALIIGPFFLEWTRFGLAVIRHVKNVTAHHVVFYDAKVVKGNDEIASLLSKLSTWACYWNGQKDFDILHANCFTFCNTILENIECLHDLPSHMKEFLNLFKYCGVCGNTVYLNATPELEKCVSEFGSESLISKLNRTGESASSSHITFTNQRVFNEFTSIIQQKLTPTYLDDHKSLKYQLQMIERGFWYDMERNGPTMYNEPLYLKQHYQDGLDSSFGEEVMKLNEESPPTCNEGASISATSTGKCQAMFNSSGLLEHAFHINDEHNVHTDFEFSNYRVEFPKL